MPRKRRRILCVDCPEALIAAAHEVRSVDNVRSERVACLKPPSGGRAEFRFYNATERRPRHIWQRLRGTDRMGTWWRLDRIERVCRDNGLACACAFSASAGQDQPAYRFDVKITHAGRGA